MHRNTSGKKEGINFKLVGETTQFLLDDLYRHKFTKNHFNQVLNNFYYDLKLKFLFFLNKLNFFSD